MKTTKTTRSFALAALVSIVLVGIILTGTRSSLDRTINAAIASESLTHVRHLTRQIQESFPELDRIARDGLVKVETRRRLQQQLVFASGLVQLKVYSADGLLRYVHDQKRWLADGSQRSSEALQDSRASGHEVYKRLDADPGTVLIRAVEPLATETQKRFGYLEITFDHSDNGNIFRDGFRWMIFALPLLMALAYLGPTLGWLYLKSRNQRAEARLRHMARRDSLTGLMNRATFTAEAEAAFAEPPRPLHNHGIILIDVDQFRGFNAAHGHELGDAYLQHLAETLRSHLRKEDLIARLGGDEFAALLPHVLPDELQSAANRLRAELRRPFQHEGKAVAGRARIGTCLATPNDTLDELLKSADIALTHAKRNGTDQVVAFTEGLDSCRGRCEQIESTLRYAWDTGRAHMVYQPVIDAKTQKIKGFEALMRLTSEDGTPISPAEFIPIAEQTGQICDLGRRAMEEAMRVARDWPEDVFLAINLSPAQFRDESLVEEVRWLIDSLDFPAHRLEFEITEGLLLEEDARVQSQFKALKAMGISMAMDDFGTGFSSLSYLLAHDFDKLKIDRSFLTGLADDVTRQRKVLKSIIDLGQQLGLVITTEGVETTDQIDLLTHLGCDLLQGFYFSKPLPEEDAHALLLDDRDSPALQA
ncbi:MAG: bifunctional diguanylate cyclase/phosphodiesterase [Silicimonas sp.]|nr:bifunctional diguanylate cyclase/phosphodiesterase [Silicimonas sp.]